MMGVRGRSPRKNFAIFEKLNSVFRNLEILVANPVNKTRSGMGGGGLFSHLGKRYPFYNCA